jgi:hypothetical protein
MSEVDVDELGDGGASTEWLGDGKRRGIEESPLERVSSGSAHRRAAAAECVV